MNAHQKIGWIRNTSTHGSRTYCRYRADTIDDPPNRLLTVQSGPAGQCPSINNFHMEKAEHFNPDGKPFDTEDDQDKEDHEKSREIEESIRCRKVAIACKTVLEPSHAAPGEELDRCPGSTLKDRVSAILQQRQSSSFLSKVSN